MSILQIFFLFFIVFVLVRISGKFRRAEISAREWVWWTIFWAVVGLITLLPQTADLLARWVGLETGRGVDLVVYISVPVLFYIIFRLFTKVDRIERQLTKIVRRQALDNPDDPKKQNHA